MTALPRALRTSPAAFILALLALCIAGPVSAQVPQDTAQLRRMAEQQFGPGVTQEEVMRRLQASGMTRSQVQARLQQMGYDSRLADAYFDAMERGEEIEGRPAAPASTELVDALSRIGVQLRAPQDTIIARLDSIAADSALREAERSRIFGKTLFARATGQFEPMLTGPVSRDYQLGPGDELWLILTGDVERSYPLSVTREGFLIIPQVGQVPVNGLTLDQL
jgi:polysaccharide biosynthesis/export protein